MDSYETKIFNAILIAAGVLALVVGYFIVSIFRNQRRHMKLQEQNLLVEITTLENERKRIVEDLHDELGPLLSVVKFQVSGLETQDPDDLKLIEKASNNLDNILQRIRGICNELMPQALIRKGLILAIEEFLADLSPTSPLKLTFTYQTTQIHPHVEVHLYRMIQEIVNNAIKHSRGTRLSIDLRTKGNLLIITTQDDGIGLPEEARLRQNKGMGLKNILSRVDILKGDVYLASEPNKGTTYTIEVPNV